jgi:hypothetical protein
VKKWEPAGPVVAQRREAVGRDALAIAALLAFMLVYLSPFIVPNTGLYRIGNDFRILYASYATYSVDAARSGFVPLWNPNEGCGYPFYSNPFTAFFYPGRILYFMLAAGSPQYSWFHHQLYMVVGICIFVLGLYAWLRGRNVGLPAALFAAGVVAIGFRIADIYRFPNAVHAAGWMPWILYAFDRWIDGRVGRGFLLGIFAMVCLGTAGYPYYSVYAAVLTGSYVILRLAEGVPLRRALAAITTTAIPAACLLLPYYNSMSRMLGQTVDRQGANFQYSTSHPWSWIDLLGGLVFPPSAMSEGWLYCGLLPLLIVFVWVAVQRPLGAAVLWVVALTFVVQLFAAGSQSFLFPFLWSFAPGVNSLRVWPRMTIVLLPPLALLIAFAYHGIASARIPDRLIQRCVWRTALVIAALQIVLLTTKTYSYYYPHFFSDMLPAPFIFATFVAAMYLTIWIFHRTKYGLAWAFVALLVTASDTGVYGRQIWRAEVGTPVPSASLNLTDYYRRYFSISRTPVSGMVIPYAPTSGLIENWHFERYANFVKRYSDRPGFAELTGSTGRKIFFSASLQAEPEHFEQWWREARVFEVAASATAVPVGRYDGNALRLAYRTTRPGYLIFVDNWDPDWRATVNGAPVSIALSFGTFKAVQVPAGTGEVAFEYTPRLRYCWISVLGAAIAVAILVFEIRKRRKSPIVESLLTTSS